MFETVIKNILTGVGASDGVISAMGPTATIFLALAFGGAAAQFLKYPISHFVKNDQLFSWLVRALAITVTFAFAHTLSETVPTWVELGAAITQPAMYHLSLAVIRRYWPWLENSKMVGSVKPPEPR